MNEIVFAILAALVIASAILGFYLLGRRRERLMLRTWADQNRFQLLHFRPREFFEPAPFSFFTSHRTPNYFVTVKDEKGKERSAWLRLGTIFASIYFEGRDRVEVRWVDP